jgi:lipoate-protein ligase A
MISFTNVGSSSSKRLLFRFPLLLRGYSCFQRNHYYSATATTTDTATTTTTSIRRTSSSTMSTSTSTKSTPTSTSTSNSATAAATTTAKTKTKTFRWLDLEGSGLSMLERLSLEEALLRNTQDNWIIVGRHTVWPNKYITTSTTIDGDDDIENKMKNLSLQNNNKNRNNIQQKILPEYITTRSSNDDDGQYDHNGQHHPNPNGMIVMGIGGKPQRLLNIENIINDKLLVVKRFSGGGTVVMDENAIWTTIIAGRRRTPKLKHDHHDVDDVDNDDEVFCKPYPRSIMEWTANAIYGPTFERMNEKLRSTSSSSEITTLPKFSLREDDYVLNGTKKMGGNAQAITGRQGWLHHTSFLWDYKDINMERYLKLPEKRPDYRSNRTHQDFLVKLKDYYGKDHDYRIFIDSMKEACEKGGLIETDWSTVYREVFCNDNNDETDSKDGMESWWLENRTRILHEL